MYYHVIFAFIFLFLTNCGKDDKNTDSGTSITPITTTLKYVNGYPFNFVYTAAVTLGGQAIDAVVDTGSSNFLVIGDKTTCPNCINEYGYNSTYSVTDTSQKLNSSWQMSYLPIGYANVQGYQDTVEFGGHTIDNYNFGLVTSEKGIPNIWGIAYSRLAKPSGTTQVPLFDKLVGLGLRNQFSMRLCGNKAASTMVLGAFDADLNLSQVQWTPIIQKLWYQVNLKKMYVQSSTTKSVVWQWQPTSNQSAIVDSGTNPVVIPTNVLISLVKVFKDLATANSMNIPDSFWPTEEDHGGAAVISNANVAKFPRVYLEFLSAVDSTKTFVLMMDPSIYFQTQRDGKKFLAFQAADSGPYILGTAFMENYVVLHSRGTLQDDGTTDATASLGFYPSASLCK